MLFAISLVPLQKTLTVLHHNLLPKAGLYQLGKCFNSLDSSSRGDSPSPYSDNMVFQLYISTWHVLGEDICSILFWLFLFVLAMLKRCGIHHSTAVIGSRNNLVSVFDISQSTLKIIVPNGCLNCFILCLWAFGFSSPSEFVKNWFSPISCTEIDPFKLFCNISTVHLLSVPSCCSRRTVTTFGSLLRIYLWLMSSPNEWSDLKWCSTTWYIAHNDVVLFEAGSISMSFLWYVSTISWLFPYLTLHWSVQLLQSTLSLHFLIVLSSN